MNINIEFTLGEWEPGGNHGAYFHKSWYLKNGSYAGVALYVSKFPYYPTEGKWGYVINYIGLSNDGPALYASHKTENISSCDEAKELADKYILAYIEELNEKK